MASLTERVVQRATRQAKEFTSPEALREYLKEHPDADKAKHTVKKPGGPGKKQPPPIPDAAKKKQVPPAPKPEVKKEEPKAPKPEAKKPEAKKPHHDEHGDHDEHEAPKGAKPGRLETWKDTLKGLSDAAQSFAKSAPKAIKSFLGDHEFRKNTLKEAGSHLAKTPKKMLDNLVDTAKHEVKEFKDAAAGVKSVLSGGKMTKHQNGCYASGYRRCSGSSHGDGTSWGRRYICQGSGPAHRG
jgi:outer membrane biosynthesis protein TonB